MKFGLTVANEGFPIVFDVTSGNQSDNVWNQKILNELQMGLLETWDIAYVADFALITEDNVGFMVDKRVRLISRPPAVSTWNKN